MGSREPIFDIQSIEEDSLPSRWTLLWKLHGSINWRQDENGEVLRRPADADDGGSALVYPSHLKYDQSRRQPYLAMMDRLKAFLKKPGAILVSCGFSYRDQHINEIIDQSLRGNPTASVQGLLFEPVFTTWPYWPGMVQLLVVFKILGRNRKTVMVELSFRTAGWETSSNSGNCYRV
jgi:hypothetical protein